ncbi:MAG: hypothetical protein ACI9UQ_002373 [Candidatus Krumholzibacteriia bacterium]|jgi:hypothetical protein
MIRSYSKKIFALLGLAVAMGCYIPSDAEAQSPMAGRNIGQRISPDDARIMGRGGWGMAVADTSHPGFKNTASLSHLRHVALKYSGYGELADSESANGTRRTSGVYSPGLQFALPVIKGRVGFTAGFSMVGSTRWESAQVDTVFAIADTLLAGAVGASREGTRFRVPVGLAWSVVGGLSLSGGINLESGSIREEVIESFDSFRVTSNLKETQDLFHGTSYTIGALWKPFDRLSMGASWTMAHDLRVDRTVKVEGVTARFEERWEMKMPDEYMAGFQFRLSERWQMGADAQFMPFTEFTGREEWEGEMEDEIYYGGGFERLKFNKRRGGLGNLPFRLGASYHQWGYQIGGAPIEEYTFSVGTGFGFADDMGQMDLSFSYGIIGDLETNGVKSEVYRLGISVTGLESWW